MFHTRKDVDRHVQDIFRKIKNEREKNLRCYQVAKLYYQVGEFDIATKYIYNYLSVRGDSADGHKLLGQIFEKLNQKEKAIAEYKASLELDSRQPQVVLKVCELLADIEVPDFERAKYWCERAENHFPHHPVVFRLKERMLKSKGAEDSAELEGLIAAELVSRPKDVSLRVKLLQFYLNSGRVREAYCHALQVDSHDVFRDSLKWYNCLKTVFQAYEKDLNCTKDWEFYMHYLVVMERVVFLLMQEHRSSETAKSSADTIQVLFSFDQLFEKAAQETAPHSQQELFQEFLRHMRGQLCLHLSTVILKRAKKEQSNWKDSSRVASCLLLHALLPPIDTKSLWVLHLIEARKKLVERLALEGAYRFSQAGHVVLGMISERRNEFLDNLKQYCSGNWRERIYQRIFNSREYQQAMSTSYFVNTAALVDVSLRLPTSSELKIFDERSQKLYPGSLHHMSWLGLHAIFSSRQANVAKVGDFRCSVFEKWPLTCNNLNFATADTLNQLDIDAFLYATVLCAASHIEDMKIQSFHSGDEPRTFPACITQQLCTATQARWWTYVYQMYTHQIEGDMTDIRQILRKGIEVVRVLGSHGLDVKLLVVLARMFTDRATALSARSASISDITAVEARAELYWNSALPLLERMRRNQVINAPQNRMFEYKGKDLSSAEVTSFIEEGRLFLGCQHMKREENEKALEIFQDLKSPYAAFYQANIYRKLASEELGSQHGGNITSEMRSRNIILLTKARDCLYLTLDRLRAPGVDPKHPLNAELSSHIEDVESQLSCIAPESSQDANHELDAVSDESVSLASVENMNSLLAASNNGGITFNSPLLTVPPRSAGRDKHLRLYQSTPHRADNSGATVGQSTRRTEVRPSPERLDAQIRHLLHSHGTQVINTTEQIKNLLQENQHAFLEHNKTMFAENQRAVLNEFQEVKLSLEELKKEIQEIKKELKSRRGHFNTDLSGIGDDDLYVFDEEDYTEDVNVVNPPLTSYPSFPSHSYARMMFAPGESQATPSPLITSPFFPRIDPSLMYASAITNTSYYNQTALPFSEGQQLPDFRNIPPPQTFIRTSDPKPQPKPTQAPVNVVITTSDTLPRSAPTTLPTLSVTIPPQYRPSVFPTTQNPLSNIPHAFQIPMPVQAQFPQVAALDQRADVKNSSGIESYHSDEEPEEGDHDPSFEPAIPLPAEVEVPTGEENEEVLFETRAKLFRFVEKEWKERGIGNIKLLHNKETGKVRILMRREQVLKICANHFIDASMELKAMSDKSWIWAANDFADEEVRLETLCVRFKTFEESANFKEAFDKAKSLIGNIKTPEKISFTMNGSGDTKTTNSTGKIPTLAPPKFAFSGTYTGIPSNLSDLNKQSTPIEAVSSLKRTEKETSDKDTTSATSSTATSKISYGGFTFLSAPSVKAEEKPSPLSSVKNISKTNDNAEKQEKPSPFAKFTFTLSKTTAHTCPTTSSVTVSQSSFPKTVNTSPINMKKVPADDLKTKSESKSKESEKNTSLMFKSFDSNLTFASVAEKEKGNVGFKKDDKFTGFEGAGTPVFCSIKESSKPGDETVEDFVPTAEFKPVIPLPDLVEVKTGEEGEEILFKQRAKLMRYDSDSKQWKERGLGEMKVLRNPQTGLVRLLMRREQVLKVCCNHVVTPGIEFKTAPSSDRSLTWIAQDYSDGELKNEAFAIRFKTVDQLQEFKSVLDNVMLEINNQTYAKAKENIQKCKLCHLVTSSGETCDKCKAVNPKSSTDQRPLSELFKPKTGSWECKSCYVRNDSSSSQCVSCGSANLLHSEPKQGNSNINTGFSFGTVPTQFNFGIPSQTPNNPKTNTEIPLSETVKVKPGSWECKTCYVRNDATSTSCVACSTAKPGSKNSTADSKLGSSPLETKKFTFGIPENILSAASESSSAAPVSTSTVGTSNKTVTSTVVDSVPPPAGSSDQSFTFGSVGKFNFSFSGVRPKSPVKSPGARSSHSVGDDGSGSEVEEDDGEHIYFQPVIPLPDKVEVVTGEEDEEVLYCHRAKLYRYVENEWKDRGVGDIKLLHHKNTGKLRLVMRREQVLKICLNHYVTPEIIFSQKDDKSWVWGAPDFSEGYIVNEKFAVRFKTSSIAQDFYSAVKKAQAKLCEKVSSVDQSTASPKAVVKTENVTSPVVSTSFASASSVSPAMASFTFSLSKSTAEQLKSTSPPTFSLAGRFTSPQTTQGVAPRSLFGGNSSIRETTEDNVEVIYELEVSPEERAAAERLQLPKNFFSYRRRAPCPGCIGCEPGDDFEDEAYKDGSAVVSSTTTDRENPSVFDVQSSITSSSVSIPSTFDLSSASSSSSLIFGGKTSQSAVSSEPAFTPATTTSYLFGQSTVESTTTSSSSNSQSFFGRPTSIFGGKTTLFGGQTTISPIFRSPAADNSSAASNSVFGGLKTDSKKNSDIPGVTKISELPASQTVLGSEKFNVFQADNIAVQKSNSDSKEKQKSDSISFPLTTMPSFADIAKSGSTAFGGNNSNFIWAGANTPLFGAISGKKDVTVSDNKKDDSSGDEAEDDCDAAVNSHDPHFEPVIAMPEVVEVKTGEEDEVKLFCQRAKLYRYESSTKEWKERGVGEMKILHHPLNNTYRLLLRREQVHKVVCNHLVTPSLELSPLNTSDRAFIWGALNYAEDEPQLEQLAVRFKTVDLASEFKTKIEECKAELAKNNLTKLNSESQDATYSEYERRPTLPAGESVHIEEVVRDENSDDEECTEDFYFIQGEDYGEDDEDDESDRCPLFKKRATLFVQNPATSKFEPAGLGEIQILYDSNIFGAHILMEKDGTEEILCDTLIAMNSTVEVKDKDCTWSGTDYSTTKPVMKTFLARFSSEASADEFCQTFNEGKSYAENAEIMEHIVPESSANPQLEN